MFLQSDFADIYSDDATTPDLSSLTLLCDQISHLSSYESASTAATEGIDALIKRLILGTINIIVKITRNLTSVIKGITLPKRSALAEVIDSNVHYNRRLASTKFQALHKVQVGKYLFTESPVVMANWFEDTYRTLNITTESLKATALIYNNISASIRISDDDTIRQAIEVLDKHNNASFVKTVENYLMKTVITTPNSTLGTIGEVFNSTGEIIQGRDAILVSMNEISNFISCSNEIKTVEKSWERIITSLKATDSVSMSTMKSLATTIDDTATRFNRYATMSLEYHHLELWMSNVLREAFQIIKRDLS